MRLFIMMLLLLLNLRAGAETFVFVSFSMPRQLLMETLKDAARLHIPAVLNGLVDNSMPETMGLIGDLSAEVPHLQLQIDPRLYEQFKIQQVPALVVKEGKCFDVIFGNISLARGIERIEAFGECKHQGGKA